MKQGIHPEYKATTIVCACGNRIETKSTEGGEIHVEICSVCHPFYTGKQRLVDTAGRVERFKRKYGDTSSAARAEAEKADKAEKAAAEAKKAEEKARKKPAAKAPEKPASKKSSEATAEEPAAVAAGPASDAAEETPEAEASENDG